VFLNFSLTQRVEMMNLNYTDKYIYILYNVEKKILKREKIHRPKIRRRA